MPHLTKNNNESDFPMNNASEFCLALSQSQGREEFLKELLV